MKFTEDCCDRCTADIDLPITGNNEILIKYADKELDDGDIIYIMKESTELNVAKIILDSIIVGLPIRRLTIVMIENLNLAMILSWTD